MPASEEIDSFYIIISLVGVCVAITIITLFIIFNSRKSTLIQDNLELKLKNQKRQHDLELQALRSQMNPHFVHNSLNAIQYYVQRNEVELSEDYLSKFSKLVRQFFEFSRKKSVTIKDELLLLQNYLDIEKLRFEEKLSFEINVDSELDIEEQVVPSMILQPIVENAVNHGIFHKQSHGLVKVEFKKLNEEAFQVLIEDDGIGINKATALYQRSSTKQNEKSSAVLEERIELLKQSRDWNIEYSIQDLSDISQTNGTRVSLIFNQSDV